MRGWRKCGSRWVMRKAVTHERRGERPAELAETPAAKAKTSAKMARSKAAGGATLGQDNGKDANGKRR